MTAKRPSDGLLCPVHLMYSIAIIVTGLDTKSYVIEFIYASTETSTDSVITDSTVDISMARDDMAGSRS